MKLYTIIGHGGADFEFRSFNDTASVTIDEINAGLFFLPIDGVLDSKDIGFATCESRNYTWVEENEFADVSYVTITPDEEDRTKVLVNINTDSSSDKG